jgi:hypothetical protein
MQNIEDLINLVQSNYPISSESEKIFTQSIEVAFQDFSSNKEAESQDPTLVPVFCAKFLHLLEKEGVEIESIDSPVDNETRTYRCSNLDFSDYLDLIGLDIEPMIISKLVETAILDLKNYKKVSIYSVIPRIDHVNKNAFVFIRGNDLNLKER